MTLTHMQERVPAAERIAVRCVDSDVHPVPKRGELTQYIPEPWRSRLQDHKVGELIYYDAPDYAHAYAMRTDTFPPDGEFHVIPIRLDHLHVRHIQHVHATAGLGQDARA